MAKDHQLGVRVSDEIKAALERAAKADDRTVSYIVGLALEEWLRKHGFLKGARGGPKAVSREQDQEART